MPLPTYAFPEQLQRAKTRSRLQHADHSVDVRIFSEHGTPTSYRHIDLSKNSARGNRACDCPSQNVTVVFSDLTVCCVAARFVSP